jgi:hypothetical protein
MICYFDDAQVPCVSLKNLSKDFQEIIKCIPNPEFKGCIYLNILSSNENYESYYVLERFPGATPTKRRVLEKTVFPRAGAALLQVFNRKVNFSKVERRSLFQKLIRTT